jgi:hypothetical protein
MLTFKIFLPPQGFGPRGPKPEEAYFEVPARNSNMISIHIYGIYPREINLNRYSEFLTLFWFAMLVNEYRLEIQFKKVQKIRNINNIPTVGSRPLECKPAQNVRAERTLHGL